MIDERKKKFHEWARSFSGCDGGNIEKARTWFCGIEWGLGKAHESMEKYYQGLSDEFESGFRLPETQSYNFAQHNKYPYGQRLAKLYCTIKGLDTADVRKLDEILGEDEIFKMNLFPIAFNNTNGNLWKKNNLDKITSFEDKRQYMTWCLLNRLPFFEDQVKKYNPNLILCTGTEYLDYFMTAFGARNGQFLEPQVGSIEGKSEKNLQRRSTTTCDCITALRFLSFPLYLEDMDSIATTYLKKWGRKLKLSWKMVNSQVQ